MDPKKELELQRDAQLSQTAEQAHGAQIEGRLKDLHTMLPGIIVSFDPDKQTAVVQPAIKRIFTEKGALNLPVCVDVPVAFPGGGDFFITFPVKPGDECILGFSERCIDNWYASGGTQEPAEYRLHDLSDGIAQVGLNSQPRKIPSFNAADTELRDRARTVRITMKPDGTMEHNNPGGTMTLQPGGKVIIDFPQVEMTGTLTVAQLITGHGGMSVDGGSGVAVDGTINATDDVVASGVSLNSHHHTGVTPGGGNTGGPV